MNSLSDIADQIRIEFDARTQARDKVLLQARHLTRFSAQTIRAIHRNEVDLADENLNQARALLETIRGDLQGYVDMYHEGYTQDAIKEFVEATITCALILNKDLPTPADLRVENATYLKGLAEVPGELRRRCLDILRLGYSDEAERLLSWMDEIYAILVTMDYPDAITYGLRRSTDLVRGIVERTRGDMTLSLREEHLKQTMDKLMDRLP